MLPCSCFLVYLGGSKAQPLLGNSAGLRGASRSAFVTLKELFQHSAQELPLFDFCSCSEAPCGTAGIVLQKVLTQVRWTRYNPSFVEPEVNKELYRKPWDELSEEEKEKQELRALQPIKAAPPSVSCSVFSDPMISKFTNMMMKNGNKVLARSLMAQTLEAIKRKQLEKYHKAPEDEKEKIECNPYVIFHQALKNCQPIIGLSNITKGGKTYQVPVPLKDNRKRFLAMKWLITECRENKHRRMLMPEKLSQELLLAFNNEGPIIKKKHVLHKMAEANRAYAHFRWW